MPLPPYASLPWQQTWNRQVPLPRELTVGERTQFAREGANLIEVEIINAHLFPQISDHDFNEAGPITLAASASRSVVVSFTIPRGMLGILRSFATAVQNAADWGRVRWALTINASPVHGYDNLLGPISDILYPRIMAKPLFQGQVIRVVATNLTATAISNVTAAISGNFFPAR